MDIFALNKRLQEVTNKQNDINEKMKKICAEDDALQKEASQIEEQLEYVEGEESKKIHIGSRFDPEDFERFQLSVEMLRLRYSFIKLGNAVTIRALVKYINDNSDIFNFIPLYEYLVKEMDIISASRAKSIKSDL